MRFIAVGGLLATALAGSGASAANFVYDGSYAPTYRGVPNQSWYYLQVPSGQTFQAVAFYPATSWGSNGQYLTMNTAYGNGIWIGAIPSFNGNYAPNWQPSPSTTGNAIEIRAAVSAGAKEWSLYLNDGSNGAAFEFSDTSVRYWVHGPSGSVPVDYPLDATQFHTYGLLVRDGDVLYTLDGAPLYAGPAYVTSDWSMLVGDGSGSTRTGSGSFYLDNMVIDTAPAAHVPEPATLGLFAGGLLVMWRRHRRP